jgi:hypothetical protein
VFFVRRRPIVKFLPGLDPFEARQMLSAASVTMAIVNTKDASHTATTHAVPLSNGQQPQPEAAKAPGYLLFRVTNTPFQTPYELVPPFQQVLVQNAKPEPGQVYNVAYVTVKNGTGQTFTASNGFTVRMTNQPRSFAGFPILTGDEQWKPGQILVFYVLTKKYYPVSFVAGGFQFDTGGRSSTAVPGPAGIFLRLKYNPANFASTLNWIVAYGPGNESGKGARFGLPNTAINQLTDARTHRIDFAGHF